MTGDEILSSNQRQTIEQVYFAYSLPDKAFERQIRTIEEQVKKIS